MIRFLVWLITAPVTGVVMFIAKIKQHREEKRMERILSKDITLIPGALKYSLKDLKVKVPLSYRIRMRFVKITTSIINRITWR